MTPGQFVRRLLGPKFHIAADHYRRVFVDMAKVADWLAARIPQGAKVLDIGGGDGYVVDLLLDRRPDLRITMTDTAAEIGGFISAKNLPRVALLPATDVADLEGHYDVMTLSDVIHHVPKAQRPGFYSILSKAARRFCCGSILIKDIEPGSPRAALSVLADHYITGDKGVSLVSSADIVIEGFRVLETSMPDFPNYCVRLESA